MPAAALIARGFAEMARFGSARGARPETLAGLSGLGDLVLTCSSTSSRNYSFGPRPRPGRERRDIVVASPHRGGGRRDCARAGGGGARDRDRDADRRGGARSAGRGGGSRCGGRAIAGASAWCRVPPMIRNRSLCPSSPNRRSAWARAARPCPRAAAARPPSARARAGSATDARAASRGRAAGRGYVGS